MKKVNKEFEDCKTVIEKYIPKEDIVWPKEIKLAKKLLKKYPIEFWEQYTPPLELYSLAFLLSKDYKKELDKEYNLWQLVKPKENVVLSDKPVIKLEERLINKTKNKTLLEFVDEVL